MTAVLGKSWLRAAASSTVLVLAGALAGITSPAQAAAGPDATVAAATPAGVSSGFTVKTATTEQIRAMAAANPNGRLITLDAGGGVGTAGASIQVTCYLYIGIPYGGGAWNAYIAVYGEVTCDDYIHIGVLTVELFRGLDRVANTTATYPYVYGIWAIASVPTCTEGVYFGIVGATVTRYGFNPPSATANMVGYPVYISCAPAPPQPAPLTLTNPGARQSLDTDAPSLQMTATGGTVPYTWSATGLPAGLSINPSSGLISGTTQVVGGYTVTVTVVDAAGRSASTQFTWAVKRDGCARC